MGKKKKGGKKKAGKGKKGTGGQKPFCVGSINAKRRAQGRSPGGGLGGRSPPENFLKNGH